MKVLSWFTAGVCAVVVSATTLAAQQKSPIGKGGWIVGGSAGLSHSSNEGGGSSNNVSLAPLGLYFVAPRLALGGTLDLAYSSSTVQNIDSHDSFVGIEPTVRYFFGDPAGKLFPFLNASIGPSWEHFHVDGSANNQTVDGLDVTASAGLMQMLATHVGLTGELYYAHQHRSSELGGINATSNRNSYGLRFGFSAFVF